MGDLRRIRVEVVFATADTQQLRRLEVEEGATLRQAIELSGLQSALDDAGATRIGVFGRLASLTDLAAEGDRIEIYRELLTDPKASRRRRAARRIKAGGCRG